MLRDVQKLPFWKIAEQVVNLQGQTPSKELVRTVYRDFQRKAGRRKTHYDNCGRKPWKVDQAVRTFLEKRLLALRKEGVCTSQMLQKELAAKKHVKVEESCVRKILNNMGYYWLPRSTKRVYTHEERQQRLAFARKVDKMTAKELDDELGLAIDGIVFTVPPPEKDAREAFCKSADTHLWRKRSEALHDDAVGKDEYSAQIPKKRMLPMWGGVSCGGCAVICFHGKRKLTSEEWARHVDAGKLVAACKTGRAARRTGPWKILCDGETFLNAPASRSAHKRASVKLWQIPAHSPDLNPAEKFWSWLRRKLRQMDLADLSAKRPPVSRVRLQARVRTIMRTEKAKVVARNCARGLKRVCATLVKKGTGAATRG